MNFLKLRSGVQAILQSVLPCLLAATVVYGTFSCKSNVPAEQGAKRGAKDPKCNTLTVETCTAAECTVVGNLCSGTADYCAGFKNDESKCPASCLWKNLTCLQLEEPVDTATSGSSTSCKAYKDKTSCPSTCEWNVTTNPPMCTEISNPSLENCSQFFTQATCTGTCEWIQTSNSCQTRGSQPFTPNSVNNNCAQVNILMCLFTEGCAPKLAMPPTCGPKQ
jgi:hypothetical protein